MEGIMAEIREDLLQKLGQIAERQHRDINDVLSDLLAPFDMPEEDMPPANTLAGLAALARKANMRGKHADTVANSREILNTEYAEHLQQRATETDDHPH
jgi:hypothetical protein